MPALLLLYNTSRTNTTIPTTFISSFWTCTFHKTLYLALSLIPPEPFCLALIPCYPNSSAVSHIFSHVTDLGVWTSLFLIWGWENHPCFDFSLTIPVSKQACHHSVTYITGDLSLLLFIFPSPELDTLLPCPCVLFTFFFSNRENPIPQPTLLFYLPVPILSMGISIQRPYYILLATVYSFMCVLFSKLNLNNFGNMIQVYFNPESLLSQFAGRQTEQCPCSSLIS